MISEKKRKTDSSSEKVNWKNSSFSDFYSQSLIFSFNELYLNFYWASSQHYDQLLVITHCITEFD